MHCCILTLAESSGTAFMTAFGEQYRAREIPLMDVYVFRCPTFHRTGFMFNSSSLFNIELTNSSKTYALAG